MQAQALLDYIYLGKVEVRKEELEEGLEPADSSSLLRAEPLSRKVESISPDLRNDPDPPPGLQDILQEPRRGLL